MNKIEEAIKTYREAFKKDKGFRESYKANIAMSFRDEYDRVRKEKGRPLNLLEIQEVSNRAADNFINLWTAKT